MKANSRRKAKRKAAAGRDPLAGLRRQIDALDAKLVGLLDTRATLVRAVGKVKRRERRSFYDPDRALAVVERAAGRARRFPTAALRNIYYEITNASLLLECPVRVAYLGPEATYTHLAALKRFGPEAEYQPQVTLGDVFEEVSAGRADCGIVPVENSTEGMVNHTHDLLAASDLVIAGEVHLPVSHNLVGRLRSLTEVKIVYSKDHALAQCREWLEKHLPQAKLREATSTAAAAQRAAHEPGAAAICGELAARLYGLRLMARNLGGRADNITRFIIISRESPMPSSHDKTSVAFSVKDKPGALFAALKAFARAGVNMTRIESRPTRRRA
ncbi:MAG TPA: prephenate dehydratase [bacterium]|nr:prephenate dehydratase [bacterium]